MPPKQREHRTPQTPDGYFPVRCLEKHFSSFFGGNPVLVTIDKKGGGETEINKI